MQNAGKELNSDQKTALAKINEVIMTLDFARDLYKQYLGKHFSALTKVFNQFADLLSQNILILISLYILETFT